MIAVNHPYLDLAALESLHRVGVTPRNLTEGTWAGPYTSRYRGTSVEFADYRDYVDGDDIRLLDWKVYARNDRHYIRLFEAERNLVAYAAVDTSRSMAYGGAVKKTFSKLEYACRLAAALGYIIVRDGNAVGLALGADSTANYAVPTNKFAHLSHILDMLLQAEARGNTDLGLFLETLFSRVRRRGVLMIFSDFFDENLSLWRLINQYRRSNFDVMLFHVLHPEELDLPDLSSVRFVDLENTRTRFRVDVRTVRDVYRKRIAAFLKTMKENAVIRGCDYFLVHTDQNPYHFIKQCFF
jgi:uncharacterized protein (DUF58 family)